jgi:hypothetical protein
MARSTSVQQKSGNAVVCVASNAIIGIRDTCKPVSVFLCYQSNFGSFTKKGPASYSSRKFLGLVGLSKDRPKIVLRIS